MNDSSAKTLNHRIRIVEETLASVNAGASYATCARAAGISVATLGRWVRGYGESGAEGLLPKRQNSGRESVAEKLAKAVGEEEFAKVVQSVKGHNLDMESNGLAWRQVARKAGTPEPVKDYVLGKRSSKHALAQSLRNLAGVSPALARMHRGARKSALAGFYMPRKLDILPGDVFSSDDTTPIWAYWIPWPESALYPFGRKVIQGQFIPMIDVASQHVLCFALIARESSSYRAADIWGLFGHTFDLVGLPRLGLQLERGSWEAHLIEGETYQDGEPSHNMRVGGLRTLPTRLLDWHRERTKAAYYLPKTLQTFTSYLPKSKSIEGMFHRLQKFEGTLWGALGRDQMRNPYERTKRIFEACKRGSEDPANHFLSGPDILKALAGCIRDYAEETLEGRVFHGKPGEVWENALREHGGGAELPDDRKFLYRREWSLVTIHKGHAHVRRSDPLTSRRISYFYTEPTVFPELEGKQVLVYFDKERFEEPAQICDPKGEYICSAQHVENPGMFLADDLSGLELKKLYAGRVHTMYQDIVAYIPSKQMPLSVQEARKVDRATHKVEDGRGYSESVTIENPSAIEKSSSEDSATHGPDLPVSRRVTSRAGGGRAISGGAVLPVGVDSSRRSSRRIRSYFEMAEEGSGIQRFNGSAVQKEEVKAC